MTDRTAANVVDFPNPKPARRSADRMSLTTKRVEDAGAMIGADGRSRRTRIADATVIGLYLVVQPSGGKSWVVRGRVGKGRSRPVVDVTLGGYPKVSLSDARSRAKDVLALMRSGEDPRRKRVSEISVGNLVDRYLSYHRGRGTATVDKIERCLGRATRGLTQQPILEVTKAQWSERVTASAKKHTLPCAQEDAKWLRSMARWADGNGLAENSAALTVAGPEASRAQEAAAAERAAARWTLRTGDWSAYWEGTGKVEDAVWRAYLRALALTGLRRREASLALWHDVDLDNKMWSIPASNTKSGRAHWIHIGPLLAEVLASIPLGGPKDLVFPGRGNVPMAGWSKRLARARATTELPIVLHGLRRGYRTALTELRVDRDVRELMIAHAKGDLEDRYDKADLEELRREAQERFEQAWLEVIQ